MFSLIKKVLILAIIFFISSTSNLNAQNITHTDDDYLKAKVLDVLDEQTKTIEGSQEYSYIYQEVKLQIIGGLENGKEITVNYGDKFSLHPLQKVKKGQMVVLVRSSFADGFVEYQIVDKYRLQPIIVIAGIFFIMVLLLSGVKGFGSFLGMALSLFTIIKYIIPQILQGKDPLTLSITGSLFILFFSIYLAHGFSKQTTIALISTVLTLLLTGLLSVYFVEVLNLTGLASEETMSLQFGPTATINFKGLLLGGMIIGFLGVLDDITTGIAATVFELKKNNPKIKFDNLVKSTLNVGREHISSLVNTLVLAYAGTSLPLFLYIILNPQTYPTWFLINSEFIAEEITRTLSGSMGLLLAVPITTFMASYLATKKN